MIGSDFVELARSTLDWQLEWLEILLVVDGHFYLTFILHQIVMTYLAYVSVVCRFPVAMCA